MTLPVGSCLELLGLGLAPLNPWLALQAALGMGGGCSLRIRESRYRSQEDVPDVQAKQSWGQWTKQTGWEVLTGSESRGRALVSRLPAAPARIDGPGQL